MNLFIAIAALFSAIGNILMKLSSTQFNTISQIYFIAGGLSYVLNLILFKKGLSTLPLSIGYPLLATFSIVISTLMATFFLNESITNIKLLGTLLCILGIIYFSIIKFVVIYFIKGDFSKALDLFNPKYLAINILIFALIPFFERKY